MLKQLELTNVGKHSHLIIDFTNGINLIYGNSDAGKSCIIKAIKFLYYNEAPKKDAIRKEGTKKTSILATFDNNITLERIKSASVNAYILTIPGNKPERFDAIGKVVPDRIKEILQTQTIKIEKDELILNIADQMKMPFLLDKSGSFRMKLFNKLAGSDIIDKTMVSLNKDILQIGRKEKLEKEHLEEQEKNLKELTEKSQKLYKVCDLFTTQYNELKEKLSTYTMLDEYSKKVNDCSQKLNIIENQLKDTKTIDANKLLNLNILIRKYEKLNETLYNVKQIKKDLINIEERIKEIKIVDIDTKQLRNKIEKLVEFQKYLKQIKALNNQNESVIEQINIVAIEIKKDIIKYKEILKKYGKCPTCHTIINENILGNIKL